MLVRYIAALYDEVASITKTDEIECDIQKESYLDKVGCGNM